MGDWVSLDQRQSNNVGREEGEEDFSGPVSDRGHQARPKRILPQQNIEVVRGSSLLLGNAMTITQTFCLASLLALAAIMGPVARGYASERCCDWASTSWDE